MSAWPAQVAARQGAHGQAVGGVAAALGNMGEPGDSWQVHFMDTMKGGQFLNNPRTVEIFAKEAPERVLELEQYGAVSSTGRLKAKSRSARSADTPTAASIMSVTGPAWN